MKSVVKIEYTEEDLGNIEKIKLESVHSKIEIRSNELKTEEKNCNQGISMRS